MAPVKNGKLILNERPTGYPEPGKTTVYDDSELIDLDTVPLDGGMLLKTLCLSIDPYQRGRLDHWDLGKPIFGLGVAVVLRSELDRFKPGDHVYGVVRFVQYDIVKESDIQAERELRILENKEGLPWSNYIGVVGMPGKTAFYGWKEIAKAKKGETVFISSGAGAVGSILIQLAKEDGLKVIASAGSDEKVQFMKELGADVPFNYKTTNTAEVLAAEGPIHIYWDHVGGATLDAALGAAVNHARFIECGMISQYNNDEGTLLKNFRDLSYKQIIIQGYFVVTWEEKYSEEFYSTVPKLVKEGKLKFREEITKGLEHAGHVLRDQQLGLNKGKSVIVAADE